MKPPAGCSGTLAHRVPPGQTLTAKWPVNLAGLLWVAATVAATNAPPPDDPPAAGAEVWHEFMDPDLIQLRRHVLRGAPLPVALPVAVVGGD